MKSERRHHLQQNELAEQIDKAKHWAEPYIVPALVGVIGLAVAYAAYNLFAASSVSKRSEATYELLMGTIPQPGVGEDPESYQQIATNFADSASGEIAKLFQADVLLQRGVAALYRDREEANTLLADAEEAYQTVAKSTSISLLKSRASYGLALSLESQGKVAEAKEAYEVVVTLNESAEMTKLAEERIAALDRPQIQEFVTWFSEQKPSAFDPLPPPGVPSGSLLPDSPDITAPPVDSQTAEPSLSEALQKLGGSGESTQPLTDNPEIQPPSVDDPAMTENPAETPATEATVPPTEEPAPVDPPAPSDAPAPTEEPAPVDPPAPAEEPAPVDPPAPAEDPVPATDPPSGDGDSPAGQL